MPARRNKRRKQQSPKAKGASNGKRKKKSPKGKSGSGQSARKNAKKYIWRETAQIATEWEWSNLLARCKDINEHMRRTKTAKWLQKNKDSLINVTKGFGAKKNPEYDAKKKNLLHARMKVWESQFAKPRLPTENEKNKKKFEVLPIANHKSKLAPSTKTSRKRTREITKRAEEEERMFPEAAHLDTNRMQMNAMRMSNLHRPPISNKIEFA